MAKKEIKAALIYSFATKKTSTAAKLIKDNLKELALSEIDAESINAKDLEAFDLLIVGAATWFDGELPTFWDEQIPALEDINLKGKRVALFGIGNQVDYPEHFGDSIGLLADVFTSTGAVIIGPTSTDGYTFEDSKSVKNNQFVGLMLDFENQHNLNESRIKSWCNQIKKEV